MKMLRNKELPDPDKNPPVLHLGLANEQGFPHEGHLDFRDLNVNPETGTALRRGIFPNPGHQLIPGMFVRIQATVGKPKPRLFVEEEAIGSDQRGDYLLVVNDKNKVDYRPVELGIRSGTLREIESGVKATDWVVVNGLQRARPGAEVKPEQATMTESPDAKTDKNAAAAAPAKVKPSEKPLSATKPEVSPPVKPNAKAKESAKPEPDAKKAPASAEPSGTLRPDEPDKPK